jgi:hypothetical protein
MLKYPYYQDHTTFQPELNKFNPTWDYDFNNFDYMTGRLKQQGRERTNLFVDACKALQQKDKENNVTSEQVNAFFKEMDDFFTTSDTKRPRFYGNPDRDLHEKDLWKLAKAAVARYKHCTSQLNPYCV